MALKEKTFQYKWERKFIRQIGRVRDTRPLPEYGAAWRRDIQKIFDRDRAEGWKEIGFVLGVAPVNVARAYRVDPEFQRFIHKTGGRYWACPGELLNLLVNVANRREGGQARRAPRREEMV